MATTGIPGLVIPTTEKIGDWYSRLKTVMPNVAPNVINRMARGVAPDKPSEQQLQDWSNAKKINQFYNSPKYQSYSPEKKAKAEQWLYKNKVAPQFEQSGRKSPTFEEWSKFRNNPKEFSKYQMKMFDYFDPRTDSATRMADYSWRAARSFENLAENIYTLGMVHPEKASQTDYAIMNLLESAKGTASQHIDKNSPVNATYTRKFFEGLANYSSDFPLFRALSPISSRLGTVTKTGQVGGTLGSFDWATKLAETAKGRFVLNKLLNAVDQFSMGTVSGLPLWQQAVGTLVPRGWRQEVGETIQAGVQKIFKTEVSKNTGQEVLKNVLNPEEKKAVQTLGANTGTIMGPQATLATMHAAAAETTPVQRDALSSKLVGGYRDAYNKIATKMGYTDFNAAPEKVRFQIVNSVVHEVLEANKNPAAIDPKLTEFMVQHDTAEAAAKSPEFAQNVRAIQQTAAQQGLDSNKILAEETYKEASKDLPPRRWVNPYTEMKGEPKPEPKPTPIRQHLPTVPGETFPGITYIREHFGQGGKSIIKPPEPGLGPGAAHKEDIAFEDKLRHLTKGDIAIENELHQFVQVWGTYKDNGKLTPQIEQNVLDVIENNLPSGVNRRYLTTDLLDKWWSKMKFHLGEMERTGHVPKGGDPRGMFRSTKLSGKPTIWQEQLYDEPTAKRTKTGRYAKTGRLGEDD